MLGWMSKDKNSMLQVLLLSMISKGSYTANEIVEILSQGLGDWSPQSGTIYPAIHQLVKKGYLVKSDSRPMRVKISKQGTKRIPDLTKDLMSNIRSLFEFVDLFQENLFDYSQELRRQFLGELITFLQYQADFFQESLDEAKGEKHGWKKVHVK